MSGHFVKHCCVSLFSVLVLSIALVSFISCADSVPQIASVAACTIFEYTDEQSFPVARFSLFAETTADARRVEYMQAIHEETGLVWTCASPRTFSGQKEKMWAGYTNFVPASGDTVPQGAYRLYYEDAAGQNCEGTFSLSYPEALVHSVSADVGTILGESVEYIALYSEEGILLYFDKRKEEWQSNEDIKNDYTAAAKMRVCYKNGAETVVCLLPEQIFVGSPQKDEE